MHITGDRTELACSGHDSTPHRSFQGHPRCLDRETSSTPPLIVGDFRHASRILNNPIVHHVRGGLGDIDGQSVEEQFCGGVCGFAKPDPASRDIQNRTTSNIHAITCPQGDASSIRRQLPRRLADQAYVARGVAQWSSHPLPSVIGSCDSGIDGDFLPTEHTLSLQGEVGQFGPAQLDCLEIPGPVDLGSGGTRDADEASRIKRDSHFRRASHRTGDKHAEFINKLGAIPVTGSDADPRVETCRNTR